MATAKIQLSHAASRIVTGSKADDLIATLKASNQLIQQIDGSPNSHLVVLDLTTIGRASQHEGETQYILEKEGLAAAAPTIITKPIHVTKNYDGHVDAGKAPVSIGTFIGYLPIDNEDGTITFRTVASLWSKDFPSEVEDIKANKAVLGNSYEVNYDPDSASREGSLVRIKRYEFAGGAILLQSAAAHPETRVVFADAVTVLDVDEGLWPRVKQNLAGRREWLAAELTETQQRALPDTAFGLIVDVIDATSGGTRKVRRFPMHDETHRRNAWARAQLSSTDLTDASRAQVRDRIMAKAKVDGDDWAVPFQKAGRQWVKSTLTVQGGAKMAKYAGIPEEHEALVDALIAQKTTELKAQIDTAARDLKTAQDAVKAADDKIVALTTTSTQSASQQAELIAERDGLVAKLAEAEKKLGTFEVEASKLAHQAKLDATWKDLEAKYKLKTEQRASREGLLEKLVASKEPMTVEDWAKLTEGGSIIAGTQQAAHTLYAGAQPTDFGTPDPKRIGANFPAAAAQADGRPMFR